MAFFLFILWPSATVLSLARFNSGDTLLHLSSLFTSTSSIDIIINFQRGSQLTSSIFIESSNDSHIVRNLSRNGAELWKDSAEL
jgi:hypothetical protein